MHILNMVVARLEKLDTAMPVVCKDSDQIMEEHLSYLEDRGWHCVRLTGIDQEFLTLIEAESLAQAGRKVLVSIGNRSEKDLVFLAEYWDRGNRALVSAINLLAELGIDRKDFKKDFLVSLVRYGWDKPENWWNELKEKGLDAIHRKVREEIWELLKDSAYANALSDAERAFIFRHFANVVFDLDLTDASLPEEAATRIAEKILEASYLEKPESERYEMYQEWTDSITYGDCLLEHARKYAHSHREELITHIHLFEKDPNHPFILVERALFERKIDAFLKGEGQKEVLEFAKERAIRRKKIDTDEHGEIRWQELADLEPLICEPDLTGIDSLETFLSAYREDLWKYDAIDRALRRAHLPARLVEWAIKRVSKAHLMISNHWSTHYLPAETTPQGGLIQRILQEEGKKAVIVVDAFRFEMVFALQLKTPAKTETHPILALTPTETSVGMAALFSSGHIQKSLKEKSVLITDLHTQRRLDSNAAREDNLRELVPGVQICEVDTPLPEDASKIVIKTGDIDTLGHDNLIQFYDRTLDNLAKLADRLLHAGYQVHFTSDHGFYLPLSGMLEKKDGTTDYASKARYSFSSAKPEQAVYEEIDSTYIEYAESGSVYKSWGGQFWHGGISYQEVIIPHLRITPLLGERRWGVKIANKDRLKIIQKDRVELLLYPQKELFGSGPRVFIQCLGQRIDMEEPITDHSTILLKIDAQSGESVRIEVRDTQDGSLLDWVEGKFLPSRERLF